MTLPSLREAAVTGLLVRLDTVNEYKNVNDQYDYRSFVRFILIRNNQSELKKQVSREDYLRGMHV